MVMGEEYTWGSVTVDRECNVQPSGRCERY